MHPIAARPFATRPVARAVPPWFTRTALRRVAVHTRGLRAAALVAVLAFGAVGPAVADVRDTHDAADVVDKVGPAVVGIRAVLRDRTPATPPADDTASDGSGFLISADGHLLTDTATLRGATEAIVTLSDRREFRARVVGADVRTTLALLKIDGTGPLPYLRAADAGRLRVGEWVLAVGAPFRPDLFVAAGIVSAKPRDVGGELPLLQTDIPANDDVSGGPLVNGRGDVVGFVVDAAASPARHRAHVFAVPIDDALRIADQLKAGGRVVRAYIGIVPIVVPPEAAEETGLSKAKVRGAFVSHIVKGGPADKAGLLLGDIVLAVNGKPVDGPLELRRLVAIGKPGTTTVLQINRRGKPVELKVLLVETPAPVAAPASGWTDVPAPVASPSAAPRPWGLTVAPLSERDRTALHARSGVRVTAVTGGADAAGLLVGDIVLAVGTVEIVDVKQFDAVLAKEDKTRAIAVTFLRGDWAQVVRIPPRAEVRSR